MPRYSVARALAAVALALLVLASAGAAGQKVDPKKPFNPEIKPAPLADDHEERMLPGSIGDAVVGGGGRFLVLTIPSERKVAVFDVNEAKVVTYIPVNDDTPSVAAGLDKLFVTAGDKLDRYSLETFEKEKSTPIQGVKAGTVPLLMGSATRGPLIAIADGLPVQIDPVTLKNLKGGVPEVGRDKMDPTTRVSADGRVITTYNPGSSPQGHTVYLRSGAGFKQVRPDNNEVAGHFFPGPDGKYLYSAIGLMTAEGKRVGKAGAYGDGSRYCLPAAEGENYYLRIDVPGFPHGDKKKAGTVYLHLAGDSRPVAALEGVEPPKGLNHWGREKFGVDKRFFLIPSANLLVTLPDTMDRLVLHKVDPVALLEKADFDYLAVTSRPPREAVVGMPFVYEPQVKSKKGGVKMKLDAGPKEMKLEGGKLTWTPPPVTGGKEVPVSLTISDDSGRDIFHSFKLDVRAK